MSVSRLRVFLIGNHQMLIEAVAAALSAVPDMWVLGRCAADDRQLVEVVARLRPDVLTVDVEPLGLDAAELVQGIRAACPAVRIVVLTAVTDPAVAVAVARAGGWTPPRTPARRV